MQDHAAAATTTTTAERTEPLTGPVLDPLPNDGYALTVHTPPAGHQAPPPPQDEPAAHGPTIQWDAVKRKMLSDLLMPGASPPELDFFAMLCNRVRLDPFARQIPAVKRRVAVRKYGRDEWEDRWSYQVAIDGFRIIAERTGKYRGQTVPLYCGEDGGWREVWVGKTPPVAAKVGVLRSDFAEPLYAVALFNEYAQKTAKGEVNTMWSTKSCIMLSKVAEALALRKAFPQEMSGLYTDDEMAQADNPVPSTEGGPGAAATATGGGAQDVASETRTHGGPATPVADALNTRLRGKPSSWGRFGGRLLAEVPNAALRQAKRFFTDMESPPDWRDAQVEAITLVLAERETRGATLNTDGTWDTQETMFDGESKNPAPAPAPDNATAEPAPVSRDPNLVREAYELAESLASRLQKEKRRLLPDERLQFDAAFQEATTPKEGRTLAEQVDELHKLDLSLSELLSDSPV